MIAAQALWDGAYRSSLARLSFIEQTAALLCRVDAQGTCEKAGICGISWPKPVGTWFSLDTAPAAVDGPQLKALIVAFREPPAPAPFAAHVIRRPSAREQENADAGLVPVADAEAGRFFELFDVHAETLVAGAGALARLLHGEGSIDGQIAEIVCRKNEADDVHDSGLRALFKALKDAPAPMAFIIGREIYSSLEKIVDRFEDVANAIQRLVIDHA